MNTKQFRIMAGFALLTLLIVLMGIRDASANHEKNPILKDKQPYMGTLCHKDGKPGQGEEGDVVCVIFVTPDGKGEEGTVYWVALVDDNEMITQVFERAVGSDAIKSVWIGLPRGSRAA